jgi:hypothetical protein
MKVGIPVINSFGDPWSFEDISEGFFLNKPGNGEGYRKIFRDIEDGTTLSHKKNIVIENRERILSSNVYVNLIGFLISRNSLEREREENIKTLHKFIEWRPWVKYLNFIKSHGIREIDENNILNNKIIALEIQLQKVKSTPCWKLLKKLEKIADESKKMYFKFSRRI